MDATEEARTAGRDGAAGRLAATVERLRRQVREAQAAADGRGVVELAKGVLIAQLHCGPTEAARQLARLADEAGVTQLELAADVVNQAARDQVAEVTQEFLTWARADSAGDDESVAVRLRTAESGALAAGDPQAAARALLDHALAPLGAVAVAVWRAGPDGSLSLAGYAGFTDDEALRWRYVPPGVATVARRALAERQAVWIGSLAECGVPSVGGRPNPSGGRVAVPAGAGGRLVGVMEIAWSAPVETPAPAVQKQVYALADLCGHTLDTLPGPTTQDARSALTEIIDVVDGLHDPALVLCPHLDAEGGLTDFRIVHVNPPFVDPAGRSRAEVAGALLLEAYPVAAGAGGLYDMVERAYATGEPFRAERMALTALVDQIPLTGASGVSVSRVGDCVLLVWRIDDDSARLARLLQHAQRLGRIGGFEESATTGEITWSEQLFELYALPPTAAPVALAQLPRHAHPDDADAVGRFLRTVLHQRRPAATAFRLQRPDGIMRHIRVVAEPATDPHGRLVSVRGAYQDVSAQHWTEVALAATREQLAQTEQVAAERNRLALQLQHAIMPPMQRPIDEAGLRVGARYRPAEKEHLVGGDWYDAVVLPNRKVLLCVGDVAGHGIEAATGMVVLRNALRGLATTGAGPAQVLTWLNSVAHHLTAKVTATAVCGLYDPATRVMRWARAGHLPPVLVRDGTATPLPMLRGLLLGAVAEARYEEAELRLAPDTTMLLYTDGLVERRNTSMEESMAHLTEQAAACDEDLDALLDKLLTFSNADTDDDTCVMAIRHEEPTA